MYKLTINFKPMQDTNGRKLQDSDWYFHKEYNRVSLKSARKEASKLSLKKDIYEVEIELRTDDDPTIQEYWQNGKLEFKMF